jgi:hypothetical protein
MDIHEELNALDSERMATVLESWCSSDVRVSVREELQKGIDDGEGLDGRALELVWVMHNLPGEKFTDGECLDLIGIVVDAWRALDL